MVELNVNASPSPLLLCFLLDVPKWLQPIHAVLKDQTRKRRALLCSVVVHLFLIRLPLVGVTRRKGKDDAVHRQRHRRRADDSDGDDG